jgi:hypothetical protein
MENQLRRLIIDYFDKLLEFVERRGKELGNEEDSYSLIEKRELFVDEIKNVRTYNLDNLGFIEPSDVTALANTLEYDCEEVNDCLFKRFCFFVTADHYEPFGRQLSKADGRFGYLVVLDKYLSQANLECYMEALKFVNNRRVLDEKNILFDLKKIVSLIWLLLYINIMVNKKWNFPSVLII